MNDKAKETVVKAEELVTEMREMVAEIERLREVIQSAYNALHMETRVAATAILYEELQEQ